LAQDERDVTSPDGQIEFRISLAQPEPGALFQLAYQVFFHNMRLLDTSFLGLEIHNQEPILGANLGLTSSRLATGKQYNTLTAEYMQNGSLGRRLNVEVRAFNEGVAFRYIVPKSLPLDPIMLDDEATEFSFAQDLPKDLKSPLPLVAEQPGVAWAAITEVPLPDYPRMLLNRTDAKTLISRLVRPLETATPLVCPWRVLLINTSRDRLLEPSLAFVLSRDR
jgi:alpha-glucosidase